jgi:hypothetical protein
LEDARVAAGRAEILLESYFPWLQAPVVPGDFYILSRRTVSWPPIYFVAVAAVGTEFVMNDPGYEGRFGPTRKLFVPRDVHLPGAGSGSP